MYYFRRDDTGEVIEVDFETAMNASAGAFITLPCGATAVRVNRPTERRKSKPIKEAAPIVSGSLGVTLNHVKEFDEHRKRRGHHGVEFRPDPHEPTFYNLHASSYEARDRYMKDRDFKDYNKTSGGKSGFTVTPAELEAAKQRVLQEYG